MTDIIIPKRVNEDLDIVWQCLHCNQQTVSKPESYLDVVGSIHILWCSTCYDKQEHQIIKRIH